MTEKFPRRAAWVRDVSLLVRPFFLTAGLGMPKCYLFFLKSIPFRGDLPVRQLGFTLVTNGHV